MALLLALSVLSDPADSGDGPVAPVPAVEHVVLPGETLWQIASAWAPQEDPRDAVAEIVDFNGLPSAGIFAGQKIMLPQRGR